MNGYITVPPGSFGLCFPTCVGRQGLRSHALISAVDTGLVCGDGGVAASISVHVCSLWQRAGVLASCTKSDCKCLCFWVVNCSTFPGSKPGLLRVLAKRLRSASTCHTFFSNSLLPACCLDSRAWPSLNKLEGVGEGAVPLQ